MLAGTKIRMDTAWDIQQSGFLEKKSNTLKQWHWRWIRLEENVLRSFVDETERIRSGEFFLHPDCAIQVLPSKLYNGVNENILYIFI